MGKSLKSLMLYKENKITFFWKIAVCKGPSLKDVGIFLWGGGLKFWCCKKIEGRSSVNQRQNSDMGEGGLKTAKKNSDIFCGRPLTKSLTNICKRHVDFLPEIYLLRWKPVGTSNKFNHVWLLSELSKVFLYPLLSFTNSKTLWSRTISIPQLFEKNVENVDICHLKNIFTSPFYPF